MLTMSAFGSGSVEREDILVDPANSSVLLISRQTKGRPRPLFHMRRMGIVERVYFAALIF